MGKSGGEEIDLLIEKMNQVTIVQCKVHKNAIGLTIESELCGIMKDKKINN